MGLGLLRNIQFINNLYFKLWLWDATNKINRIESYLNKESKILDIGCGTAAVTLLLKEKGFNVTPIDIEDQSFISYINPIIYDGSRIPIDDNEFDISLVLTVLHHVYNPVKLIKEAKRLSKKIIIIEDIYTNTLQKYLTFIVDSIINFEFIEHPHSNKADKEWKDIFEENELKLTYSSKLNYLIFFKQALYILDS